MLDENGNVLVKLYQGAKPTTVVEEFFGNHFRRLNEADRKIWADYYQEFLNEGGRLTEQEHFEKQGKEYFFKEELYKDNPVATILRRIKFFFKDYLGSNSIKPEIRAMYEKASEVKIDDGKADTGESFEISQPEIINDIKYTTISQQGGEVVVGEYTKDMAGRKMGDTFIDKINVDEDLRRQGIGSELLSGVFGKYPNITGQASNDKAVNMNYKLGMRAFDSDGRELSLEETLEKRYEDSSVMMKLPAKGDTESFEITRVDEVADKVKGRKVRKGSEVKVALRQGLENVLAVLEDENFDMEGSFAWYRSKITDMVDVAGEEIPGLREDRVKQGIFKALLGITSHGTKVPPNYDYTVAGMIDYLENGEFNMGINVKGNQVFKAKNREDKEVTVGATKSPVVGQNVIKLKNLIDELGEKGAVEWMLTKHKGRDIEAQTGVKKYAHLKKDEEYYGALAFGAKIGRYIVNLNGIHEEAVFDVWWSRTWNRWMGTPFKVNKEGKFYKDDKGRKIIQETPRGNPERALMDEVVEGLKTELSDMTGYQWEADQVQAVLWYYEKELYIREGSQQEKGTNYAEQAVRRAKERGYYEQFTTSKDSRESTETQEGRSSVQGKPSQDIESSQKQIVRTGKTVGQKDSEVTPSDSPIG